MIQMLKYFYLYMDDRIRNHDDIKIKKQNAN